MELFASLAGVDGSSIERLLECARQDGVALEIRTHEPARHARHLAALWRAALWETGRATLFYADGSSILGVVQADRKVSAPVLRALLGARDLRVLRGDRGVGRAGWRNLPGEPGALPAIPALFGARCYVDERVMELSAIVLALEPDRSLRIAPADYARLVGATVARFSGTTRLLPEGGMVDEK